MFGKLKGRFDGQDTLSAGQSSGGPPPEYEPPRHSRPPSDSKQSAPPPTKQETPFRTNFASVSLHMTDRLRLMFLPPEVCDAVRNAIHQTWPNGIQQEREYHGSWEFKMRGNPWVPHGEDAIYARRLTRGIMSVLYSYGYVLYISTDISMKAGDKDNLFFRHQDPAPTPCEWFSCTFSRGDRLRLIDAPPDVIADMINTLRSYTQSHAPYRVPGTYEIKFNGYPFAASGGDTMVSRAMVLQMFEALERNGFTVYASVDQKFSNEGGTETDTWVMSRPVGWAPGTPVYHQ